MTWHHLLHLSICSFYQSLRLWVVCSTVEYGHLSNSHNDKLSAVVWLKDSGRTKVKKTLVTKVSATNYFLLWMPVINPEGGLRLVRPSFSVAARDSTLHRLQNCWTTDLWIQTYEDATCITEINPPPPTNCHSCFMWLAIWVVSSTATSIRMYVAAHTTCKLAI